MTVEIYVMHVWDKSDPLDLFFAATSEEGLDKALVEHIRDSWWKNEDNLDTFDGDETNDEDVIDYFFQETHYLYEVSDIVDLRED